MPTIAPYLTKLLSCCRLPRWFWSFVVCADRTEDGTAVSSTNPASEVHLLTDCLGASVIPTFWTELIKYPNEHHIPSPREGAVQGAFGTT